MSDGPGPVERFLDRPLWVHTGLVLVTLTTFAVWVGAAGRFSVDEGIAVVQAQRLAESWQWTVDHPLADLDPDGAAFPLRSAEVGSKGWVPYAKLPLYPVVLGAAAWVAGIQGIVAVSVVSATVAAGFAGLLARSLRRDLGAAAVYATGLVSPLFFDSSLVIAHALGAAALGAAAWCALQASQATAWPRWGAWTAAASACALMLAMVRNEALLLLGAAGIAAGVALVASRSVRWVPALTAATVGGVGGRLATTAWREALLGAPGSISRGSTDGDPTSVIADRLHALGLTTTRVSYQNANNDALLIIAVAVLVLVVLVVRRGGPWPVLRAANVAAGALAVVWTVTGPLSPVPGLLVACPLLWLGLAVGRWRHQPLAWFLMATFGLFALLVAATQYRQAGGIEWGARYVAIGLPLIVPVAVLGWAQVRDRVPTPTWSQLTVTFVVVSAALVSMGLRTQRDDNAFTRRIQDRIIDGAPTSHLGGDDDDGRPVIVSAEFAVPQATWAIYEDARWLRLRDDEPIEVNGVDERIERLVDGGIDRFTFVTRDLERDRPLLGDDVTIGENHGIGNWDIVVVSPLR